VIAARLGQLPRARAAFSRALGRDPGNWYALLELAMLDDRSGDIRSALRRVAAARELDPREPSLIVVQRRLESGKPVTQQVLEDLLVPRLRILTAGV
jgi:tetratricopeptide (TPR) repeat protein